MEEEKMGLQKYNDLKFKLFNQYMLYALVFYSIGITLITFHNLSDFDISNFIVDYAIIFLLVVFVIFKERITIRIKTRLILMGLIASMTVGMLHKGFDDPTKYFIILGPGLSVFISIRRARIVLAIFVAIYLLIGYFDSAGIIQGSTHNFEDYLLDGTILALISYTLLYLASKFGNELLDNLLTLQKTNEELKNHHENLATLVKLRTQKLEEINAEVLEKNAVINDTNKQLTDTIQQLRKAEIQLIEQEKMASLGTLTAGVAHEINNPLNYLVGAKVILSDYFKEHKSKEPEKINMVLESLELGTERIIGIVKGLNLFSRRNNDMDESCEIHPILNNCVAMLKGKLNLKVSIQKNYWNEEIVVPGNVGSLHQVFLNFLTNANQAIADAGIIRIETRIDEKNAIIVISDNGIGIDKEKLKQITDPFFTTKPAGLGTGLGLSIAHSIITNHKGTLGFDSDTGKGMTVSVTLPLK